MKFIYGKESFLIKKEVEKFINKYNIEPIYYSDDESIDDIILDFSTISLFKKPKLFVIQNHQMFKNNDGVDKFLNHLNQNKENKIIFTYDTDKIFRTNKLTNYLLKNAKCKEVQSITFKQLIPTINNIVRSKGGSIENLATINLSTKLPLDLRIIILEIEKLLLQNKIITNEMVEKSIENYAREDVFALSNALTQKDSHGIISAYQNKKKLGEDVSIIIGQITSTLSLALLISFY
jgi:DNA polymerase-3 subunit delta